jgi:thiamine monophosphate kinase
VPERLALAGGEDYELLFSVRPGGPGAPALARRLGLPVTEIGRLEAGPPRVRGAPAGSGGYRHF